MPDIGAQVCVTGPELLATLGIRTASLKCVGGLQDVATETLGGRGEETARRGHQEGDPGASTSGRSNGVVCKNGGGCQEVRPAQTHR